MNIALLLRCLSTDNGISRVVLAHSGHFARRGHRVCIYAARLMLTQEERRALPPGVTLRRFPCLRGSARIWSMPFGALRPYLRGEHDIVVSHLLSIWQDVTVMHNDPQKAEAQKLASAPFTLEKPRIRSGKRALRAFIEERRFAPSRRGAVVALSRRSAGEIASSCGVPRGSIEVIRNGVDTSFFSPRLRAAARGAARADFGFAAADTVFLYIGDSWKGLEFAIEGVAAARIPGAALLAAGPFRAEPFAELAARRGLRFVRVPPGSRAMALYAAADALVSPTPLDTFGLAPLEAMASGVPVMVSAQSGVSEVVTDGGGAFVLKDPFDAGEIAVRAAALASPSFRNRAGQEAAQAAAALGWEEPSERHLRLYGSILAGKGRGGRSL